MAFEVCPGPAYRERAHAVRVLARLGSPPLLKTAGKIAQCSMGAYLAERSDGTLTIVPGCCRQRLCPHCSRARSARVYNQLSGLLAEVDHARMLTLTLKPSSDGLALQLNKLYASYRKLRSTPMWKANVQAAVAVAEVKIGQGSGEWHPHLHVLWKGKFLPHAQVKKHWHSITGDSFIVHIAGKMEHRVLSRYLAKYVSKGSDVFNLKDAQVREYALAMKGRRLILTSGNWHGCGVGSVPKPDTPVEVVPLISIASLIDGHRLGLPSCTETLCLLSTLGPLGRGLVPFQTGLPPPQSVAETETRRLAVLEAARDARRELDDHNAEDERRSLSDARN